ncbi:type IV secretory system conjugative DNA transfer family protein [Paenibacillus sp. GYB003]|uniref:type IV secretory system conjugative DNA transfer family protein n=1 Tax=Paenibacillus sp. GYB003 TaxID=2994392 RepID=UPI002F96E0D3
MSIMNRVSDGIRDFHFRKWTPLILAILTHFIVFVSMVSVLAMTYSLLWGKYELSRSGLAEELPFPLPLLIWFYSSPDESPFWMLLYFSLFPLATWLLGTRVKFLTKTLRRRGFSFILCSITIVLSICYYSSLYIMPIGFEPLVGIHDNFESLYKGRLHRESVQIIAMGVLLIPYFVAFGVVSRIIGLYRDDEVVQTWFAEYKFEHKWLGRFGDEKAGTLPDITLATRVDTGVPAVLTGDSRQLGVTLLGPPGSGKTSMKIIKAFRQDMGHVQKMINDYPRLAKKYGVNSEKFKRAMAKYLIGSIIIEPAKDLCDSAYDVARKHGLPDEFIIYLDPSNEDTPGINVLVGPLSQVAETITAVLDGMSEVSNEFFRQACRTVLKMYIYLLKINRINDCDLMDLDRMYQDPRFTMDLVIAVEKTIPRDEEIASMKKDQKIYWMLVKRVIRWFKNDALAIMVDRDGIVQKYPRGHEYEGREIVLDKQSEFTRQTRNLLSDLIMNPYLARIFMNERTVDIDRIMAKGGILLCNTDNGLLGDVSDAFGKLVLMTVQNAVFRRKGDENTRALVSLYVDEFYDYMNRPFLKLASQGRKYKLAPFVACQTLSQFAIKFGDKFVDATLGTTRNLIVYGGVTDFDAEKLSKYFGKKNLDVMTVRESITPDKMQNPNFSYSESITREEVAVASEDDIMFNPFKFSYCRLVYEGSTKKAFLAEGDFIDKGEAAEWEAALHPEALEFFMSYWRMDVDLKAVSEIESVVAPEDGVEEIQKITDELETEFNEHENLVSRFDGFSGKEAGPNKSGRQSSQESLPAADHHIPNLGVAKPVLHDERKDDRSMSVVSATQEEETFSFSKNMTEFMKKTTQPPDPTMHKVELDHGPENKMSKLKDVSVDEDEDAQAFVRAVQAKLESNQDKKK